MRNLMGLFLPILLSHPALASGSKCTYSVAQDTAKVEWVAFKTTEKVAVKGAFKKFDIKGAGAPTAAEANDVGTWLRNLIVDVDTSSVETGVADRNTKIVQYFFGTLKTQKISGRLAKVDLKKGEGELSLSLNGKLEKLPMQIKYDETNGGIEARTNIDLLKFAAGDAVAAINKACYDLHKGKDGVSKTWPEAELVLSGRIQKDCQ